MDTISTTALLVAVISACIAAYTTRGNSARAGFELARTLFTNLTTGDAATARSSLERYKRGTGSDDPDKVLDHYFTLLWQLEQIHAGRQSLIRQQRLNGTRAVVRYLDEMVNWHVIEWANRWLEIRTKLEADRHEQIDDEHALHVFCQLLESIDAGHWRLHDLKAVVAEQKARRVARERAERERVQRQQGTTTPPPTRAGVRGA
ncbi:hypothetical protein ACFQ7F_27835 [Streptomyces sp. NPDC056486]|uniref:hypothetical protein n=1 Tax=Streptomyces sp. NPDC056486 TaxID=3345835 RepID=UPI00369508B5